MKILSEISGFATDRYNILQYKIANGKRFTIKLPTVSELNICFSEYKVNNIENSNNQAPINK